MFEQSFFEGQGLKLLVGRFARLLNLIGNRIRMLPETCQQIYIFLACLILEHAFNEVFFLFFLLVIGEESGETGRAALFGMS